MSQNDFSIDNGSGAAVRADINSALQALASCSAGSAAPTTTYAYQLWVDTSGASPILKIRNGANSGWIILGPVDTLNFGFMPVQVGNTAPTSPAAYQFWVDTSGSPAVLKMRNGANSAWIVFGPDATATNLGLLALTGGTLSGFLSSSNTDYWKIPVGTTGQRPGSPAAGMIRYNSTLGVFEAYGTQWSPIGSGGGGGSLQWVESDNAPTPSIDSVGNRIFSFQSALSQVLYTSVKVPQAYVSGSPIKLYLPFYSPDSSGNALLQTVSTLIRPATDAYNSTTNQRTSTNVTVSLGAGTVNKPQMVTFDLTDTTGKINGVSVSPGDTVLIALSRGSDTATSDLAAMVYTAELTIQ